MGRDYRVPSIASPTSDELTVEQPSLGLEMIESITGSALGNNAFQAIMGLGGVIAQGSEAGRVLPAIKESPIGSLGLNGSAGNGGLNGVLGPIGMIGGGLGVWDYAQDILEGDWLGKGSSETGQAGSALVDGIANFCSLVSGTISTGGTLATGLGWLGGGGGTAATLAGGPAAPLIGSFAGGLTAGKTLDEWAHNRDGATHHGDDWMDWYSRDEDGLEKHDMGFGDILLGTAIGTAGDIADIGGAVWSALTGW